MSITVNCHISWGDEPAVHFIYEDIPIVLNLATMNSQAPPTLLQRVNFIICNLYELSLPKAKLELANLKMTTDRVTLVTIVEEHGMIDDEALQQEYPDDWEKFTRNYSQASTSGNNQVFTIYEKARYEFPGIMVPRMGGKNSRRRRRKAKRSAKSMKRSRVHK